MYTVEKALYLSLCTQGLYSDTWFEDKNIEISKQETPDTILLDGTQLAKLKALFQANDEQCQASLQALLEKADSLLESPHYNVTQKEHAPAGIMLNDYVSLAKYWWPNPDTSNGLPFIRQDGHVNPECYSDVYDASRFVRMTERVQALTLAGYITQNSTMIGKAVEQLTVWFADSQTAQTPHFKWAQRIPGKEQPRGPAIIEARHLVYILEAVRILESLSAIDKETKQALHDWCQKALDWFRQSEIGQQAKAARNNIGFWYDLICIALADFVKAKDQVRAFLKTDVQPRLTEQMADDGSLDEELKRERPQDYVTFSLVAMSQLSRFGERYGLPLWDQLEADGKGFEFAYRWLLDQAQVKEAIAAGNYLKAGSQTTGGEEALVEQEAALMDLSLHRKIGQLRLDEIAEKNEQIKKLEQDITHQKKDIARLGQETEASRQRREVMDLRKQLLSDKDARIKALEESVTEQEKVYRDYIREAALKDKIQTQAQRIQKVSDGLAQTKSRHALDIQEKDGRIEELEKSIQTLEEEKSTLSEESMEHKRKRTEFLDQKNETKAKLDRLSERFDSLEKQKNARQTELANLQQSYDAVKEELLQSRHQAQESEAALQQQMAREKEELETSLQQMTREKEELETSLQQMTREKEELRASLQQKVDAEQKALFDYQNQAKEREASMQKKMDAEQKELSEYKNRFEELKASAQEKRELERKYQLQEKKLNLARTRTSQLTAKVKRLESRIEALHNSRSWRLTKPLRAVLTYGRSMTGKQQTPAKKDQNTGFSQSKSEASNRASEPREEPAKEDPPPPAPDKRISASSQHREPVASVSTEKTPTAPVKTPPPAPEHPLVVLKSAVPDSVDELKAHTRQSGLGDQDDTFVLYRIIGNDLYPRHEKGQSRSNVEFILNNEQPLEGCVKKWVVNRIFDSSEEAQIITLLEAHDQDYIHLPFEPAVYEKLELDTSILPHGDYLTSKEFHDLKRFEKRRIYTAVHRLKNNYAMNNNGARNVALEAGREEFKWVLPWDGNCFLTPSAWERVKGDIQDQAYFKYFAVPMARVLDNDTLLSENAAMDPAEEPQLVFRCDAQERFNEAYSYGRRPKVELFWRLGMPGKWDQWVEEPEDQPRRPLSPEAYQWGVAGWVARLFSGMKEQEVENGAVNRNQRRQDAIIAFLQQLDRRVAERENDDDRSLVAKSQALHGEQHRPFYFGIPVRSKACTNNWEIICANLERTLLNLSRQEDKNFKVLVAVHEIPSIRTFDLDIEFLIADFAPPVNEDGSFGNDKGPKKRMISMALSEQTQDPFYYMPLDADDLVHPSLVRRVLEDDNKRGYLFGRGYMFNQATSTLTPCDETNTEYWKHCGSCAVFHLERSDLPMSRMSSDAYIFTLKRHTEFPEQAEEHGKPLDKFSDYMGIYIINHGENNRLIYRGGWNNKDEFTERFQIRDEAKIAEIFQDYPELVVETDKADDVLVAGPGHE